MEQQERQYEIDEVQVHIDGGSKLVMHNVDEIMYAEKFILITHANDRTGLKMRTTFTYDKLRFMDVIMKEEMPVLTGPDDDVQDTLTGEQVMEKVISYKSSGKPRERKRLETATEMMDRLGMRIVEDGD